MTDLAPSTFAALLDAHLRRTTPARTAQPGRAGVGSPSRCARPSTTAWPS
jgi:hypothetical protein